MLHIQRFTVNPIAENTYLAWADNGEAMIVDCGCFAESEWNEIKTFVSAHGLRPALLVNTHLHFDHALGNRFAERDYGLRPRAARADWPLYARMAEQLQLFMSRSQWDDLDLRFTNHPGEPLAEGDELTLGDTALRVIATPGHTPGGICLYSEADALLFSGDTLFCGSYGRTDLPGGDSHALRSALLDKLLPLPDDTRVLPGHGPDTTIGRERVHYR